MYHCRALFVCIQSVWRPRNNLACKQLTSVGCNRVKLPSAGHWQAVGLEIQLMYGGEVLQIEREAHGSFSMICCYCLCDSNNNNNLFSSFQANSFCKLWALKMFVCWLLPGDDDVDDGDYDCMSGHGYCWRGKATRHRSPPHDLKPLFWQRVLCKQKTESNVDSSREHRRQTPTLTLFGKHKTKRRSWFMCEAFYCENNQQCLNLLRFAWMIPLSICILWCWR